LTLLEENIINVEDVKKKAWFGLSTCKLVNF